MQFLAQITVLLRPSVLDPAGAAIAASLHQLGHGDVAQVRIGKFIQLELQAPDAETAQARAEQMCDQLLVNPVIESFQLQLRPQEAQ